MTDRRVELAEAATDYVLESGLIGLSLRPLAEAIGTSDRMLLYHFRDKDDLVATVLRTSNDRSLAAIRALPRSPDPATAVHDLWRALTAPHQLGCSRIYVQASALGVLGREPYATVVGAANRDWLQGLADHLADSGLRSAAARRAARLVDATFLGLFLDQSLEEGSAREDVVQDLARTVAAPTVDP